MQTLYRTLFLITYIMFLCGCTAYFYTPQNLMTANRSNLSKLQIGMTKDQVMQTMGTEGKETCNTVLPFFICGSSELINNPYRTTGFHNDGKTYHVLYYWTDVKKRDGAITDDELTPLLIENGTLVGWGSQLLDSTIKKYELRVR